MSKRMDKQAAMHDFLQNHVMDRWQYDLIEIDQRYREKKESIESGFVDTFNALCTQAAIQQEQGKKGEICTIYFSFLRTSIMENSAAYRLDAYDENWFLDRTECSVVWEADFIFAPLFRRMAELETVKSCYARKITSMDIERIKLIEAIKYHLLTVEFMRSMVPMLLECQGFCQMAKSPKICLLAGEYRDQSEVLYAHPGPADKQTNGAGA
ncbi:hypothetical protein P9302_14605 [Brevibacillus agri]|uniref:hypothetical protein n=1 Tax=Brevibacillus agri TaxID=51101 RepID=UPI0024C0C0B0|nr:hypothetical protein [Brevibacillus agri]MED4570700.1 hypothetical protein [Brevibacillus agri]WHX31544.1 hypothetical protein QNK09_04715 [Brevibacillus agri]